MGLILHLLEPSALPDSSPNFLFILEAKFLEIIRKKKKKNFLYHGLLYINHKSNGTLFNIKLEFSLFLLLSLFFKISGKIHCLLYSVLYLVITLKTQETSSLFSFILT